MRRVVVTGLGIISSLGNSKEEVLKSLKDSSSGIVSNEIYKELGLKSQVSGKLQINLSEHIDRKKLRFMGFRNIIKTFYLFNPFLCGRVGGEIAGLIRLASRLFTENLKHFDQMVRRYIGLHQITDP